MLLSKYDIGAAILIGTIILALLAYIPIAETSFSVISDISILFLALSVTLIPILGEIMQKGGLMLGIINNMGISKKASIQLAPAVVGLLPIAGGALISAPLVEEIDPNLSVGHKVSINVWFRHVLVFIYPISSTFLVVSSLAGISLYTMLIILLLPDVLLIIVGNLTLIRKIEINEKDKKQNRNIKMIGISILPLLIPLFFDFLGRFIFKMKVPEILMFLSIIFSIGLALWITKNPLKYYASGIKRLSLWRFPLLIYGMFFFKEVFTHPQSGIPELIASWNINFPLFLLFSFFLGFATGRVQLPCTILIPIFLSQYALIAMPIFEFALIYTAIFMGYVLTPIHPCVDYTLRFFKAEFKEMFKYLAIPTLISLGLLILISLVKLF